MLEAAASQAEVVQPVIQCDAGHRDAEAVHIGEIRQPQLAGHLNLAKHHVTLATVHRAPVANAPLQGTAKAPGQFGVTAAHFLEHRHRPQLRRRRQQRHDFLVEDAGQRIGSATATRRRLLRWQARILLDAVGRGDAEPGLGGRAGRPVSQSELHVEPHLVIVDVTSGHGTLSRKRDPCFIPDSPRPPTRPEGAIGECGVGTVPGYARPRANTAVLLILIDALLSS